MTQQDTRYQRKYGLSSYESEVNYFEESEPESEEESPIKKAKLSEDDEQTEAVEKDTEKENPQTTSDFVEEEEEEEVEEELEFIEDDDLEEETNKPNDKCKELNGK